MLPRFDRSIDPSTERYAGATWRTRRRLHKRAPPGEKRCAERHLATSCSARKFSSCSTSARRGGTWSFVGGGRCRTKRRQRRSRRLGRRVEGCCSRFGDPRIAPGRFVDRSNHPSVGQIDMYRPPIGYASPPWSQMYLTR